MDVIDKEKNTRLVFVMASGRITTPRMEPYEAERLQDEFLDCKHSLLGSMCAGDSVLRRRAIYFQVPVGDDRHKEQRAALMVDKVAAILTEVYGQG